MKSLMRKIYMLFIKNPTNIFYNLKIRYKLVLSYFFITMIPIAAIGFLSYNSTLTYIKSQYISTVKNTQQQYSVNIDNCLKSYMYIADTISVNPRIQSYFDEYYADYYKEYDTINTYISPVLTSLLDSTGVGKGINLDLIKHEKSNAEIITNFFHGISSQATNNYLTNPPKAFNIFNINRIEDKPWFTSLKKVENYSWEQIDDDVIYNRITYMRDLGYFPETGRRHIGYLMITVRLKDIIGDIVNSTAKSGEVNMVFDRNNKILSIDDSSIKFFNANKDELRTLLTKQGNSDTLFLNNYLIVKGINKITGWKILSVFPIKVINENASKTRNITVLYCIGALVVLFAITYLLSNSFSHRIINITKNMNKFQSSDFDEKVIDKHNDEIGFLSNSFNEMTTRIKELINDNYQANIDKKETQLKLLQAQINPHFLYNSLSSISRLGDKGDSENINIMVKALTKFYRLTLNKGRDLIIIASELEQVRAYIDIYKVRKGEDFHVLYDVDENILNYQTVKLILQPFIENILEHAIYNRDNPISIKLSAKEQEDKVVFSIIDDGVGIHPDNLKNILLNDNVNSNGYGIKNVNDRIKLQFGSEYGITIFSKLGIGTVVCITIPKYTL
jgi:two-component system, sensor histidine kinase YesM